MRTHRPVLLTHIYSSLIALLLALAAQAQTLSHRYSFDDAAGSTTIADSVGGAAWTGTLVGAANVSNSSLVLDGFGSFATLPAGIISGYSNVTVEFWADFSSNNPVWTRVFAFGNQNDVGAQATGLDYTHYAGGNWQNLNLSTSAGGVYANNPGGLNGRTNVHVTVVADPISNAMLYYNNTAIASNPGINGGSTVPSLQGVTDTLNLIGKSLFDVDASLEGQIHEFRVYEGVLTPAMVAVNHAAGPDRYVVDPGALQALHFSSPVSLLNINQNAQQVLIGDFANVTGVDLLLYGGASFESGNTNVLVVSSQGLVRAVGPGTTTILARYDALTAINLLTVESRPAVLAHRYSFDSDASDSVGNAHGALMSGAMVAGGKVVLDANASSYVDLPGGIINIATNEAFTIETWVDIGDAQSWSRLFNFGTEEAANEIYFAPVGPGNGGQHRISQNIPEGQTIDWAGALTNAAVYLAVVIDPKSSTLALYRDGGLEYARYDANAPLSQVATNMAVLGRSLVSVDPYMPGAIDEFRIWSGALTPQQIELSFRNGPASTSIDPGALLSIQLPATPYATYSGRVPPRVMLNYANLTNFNLVPNNSAFVPELALSSSDTNVLQVIGNNMLRTFAPGTTTITAGYRGQTANAVVSVANTAVLAHRYSFETNTSDSVGDADGIPHGTATVSDGQLVLDGSPDTYLELPPGLLKDYDAITIDTWVAFHAATTWSRLWYFGDDRANEFYVAPSVLNGDAHWFSTGFPIGGETLTRSPRWEDQSLHITAVYGNGTMEIYTNAVFEAGLNSVLGRADQIGTWFSWIGRSPYPADPFLNVTVNEFRVYNGRLSPEEILAAHQAGPDTIPARRPSLAISKQGDSILLTWPGTATGFNLQERTELTSGQWAPVSQPPTLVNGNWEVNLPLEGAQKFFRLAQ